MVPTLYLWKMKTFQVKNKAAKIASENLKRCPLCGGVNALSNVECFVCTWSGTFDHDPASVQQGLAELMDRCPELADLMMSQPAKKKGPVAKFWAGIKSLFQREPIDIWA